MSVSQSGRAPDQPDYDAEDILEDLRQKYGLQSDADWEEEFGMTVSEAMAFAENELELGEDDVTRLKDEMAVDATMQHQYESKSWVDETEGQYREDKDVKKTFYSYVEDPKVDDAWILVHETRYEES